MPLITIVITLIVVGVLLWLVNTYIPMDGKIKKIINIVVVVVLLADDRGPSLRVNTPYSLSTALR